MEKLKSQKPAARSHDRVDASMQHDAGPWELRSKTRRSAEQIKLADETSPGFSDRYQLRGDASRTDDGELVDAVSECGTLDAHAVNECGMYRAGRFHGPALGGLRLGQHLIRTSSENKWRAIHVLLLVGMHPLCTAQVGAPNLGRSCARSDAESSAGLGAIHAFRSVATGREPEFADDC